MSERDLIEKAKSYIENSRPRPDRVLVDLGFVYDVRDRMLAAQDTIARLSEALAEAEKKGAEDWQPIETAPRDAEAVLITGGTWLYSESFADGICDWIAIASFDPNAFGDHKWNGGNGTEYDGVYWHNP
ncbi:hypothetical protein, partial [Aureimonas ureilytica]